MTSRVEIHEAVPGDEAALALVGAATFLESFAGILDGADIIDHCRQQHAPEVYVRWLADPAWKIWLVRAAAGGAPVGYLVLAPPDLPIDVAPVDLEIKRIYLLTQFHGGGVGRELVRLASAEASARGAARLLLGVFCNNERALGFYKHLGFEALGTRRFRVGHREYNDLILALPLDSGSG